MTGNQYVSRKRELMHTLRCARVAVSGHRTETARWFLGIYRRAYALVPASTRRRWRCGR